jgi:predicted ATPase
LPEQERILLRRLSVFGGPFTLDSAVAVAGCAVDRTDIVEGIANLVTKSLICANIDGTDVQYRLLNITQAYASHKLSQSGELQATLRRHATHQKGLQRSPQ